MHRMHANRVSNNGTSAALNDDSIQRIQDSVNKSAKKRTAKRSKPIKKTAKKAKKIKNTSIQIKVASIAKIPADFERIGTGFYRNSHHLWELSTADQGFVLTRKRGDDHILGYDPEPITKQSSINAVTDRHGSILKIGSKVKLPYHGKLANGTIIVLTPGSLGLDMGQGHQIDAPPDMVELTDDSSDMEAGAVFEPEISEKPKSDYVGPQSSQSGGIGGVGAETEDESEPKMAQIENGPTQTTTMTPSVPGAEPGIEPYETLSGNLAHKLDRSTDATIRAGNGAIFYARKVGDNNYEAFEVKSKFERLPGVFDKASLDQFEQNIGGFEVVGYNQHMAKVIRAAVNSQINLKDWKEYWRQVGARVARVAQAAPRMPDAGPKSIPGAQTGLPKSTQPRMPMSEEQKQQRKQRRKERKTERSGLPPGAKLPPKSRAATADMDDTAKCKEHLRMYEQLFDEVKYILQDESLREDEFRLADELETSFINFEEEMEAMNEESEHDMENSLSLDTPSDSEKLRAASKTVISMTDL